MLYQSNGYINIDYIVSLGLPFNFIVGGRGTGKTYTTLSHVVDNGINFMLMRRTQSQADTINKPQFSPMKPLNNDRGYNIVTKQISKYNSAFYHGTKDGDEIIPTGKPIGYTCALSTIANMRGFDASDVKILIYDEFIPEKHERPIKHESQAFLNAYETINRNRELKGEKPLQVIALANSNDIANPIFLELGLVRIADRMERNKSEIYVDRERGIALFNLKNSPISNSKKETALYRATRQSNFADMAISNVFNKNVGGVVISRKLAEFKAVVCVGEICIYKHKSENRYYISTHKSGAYKSFTSGAIDLERFKREYFYIWTEYMYNRVEFEEILCELLLTKYFE